MALKDIIPRPKRDIAPKREENIFLSLREEMDNLFERFFNRFSMMPSYFEDMDREFGDFSPKIDMKESDKEVKIFAELPGLNEKDLDISVSEHSLTIKGEKKKEVEDKKENYYRMERSYGSFYRTIALPEGVDTNKVDATYRKGVLNIIIPKTVKAIESRKKIEIKVE
ncbi:MAG: Hsp20/alpha crystallin family protein [bacterium]